VSDLERRGEGEGNQLVKPWELSSSMCVSTVILRVLKKGKGERQNRVSGGGEMYGNGRGMLCRSLLRKKINREQSRTNRPLRELKE